MEEVKEILKELAQIEKDRTEVLAEIKAYNEIYFMDIPAPSPPGWDKNDLRHFIDPTGHNKVKGVSDLVASTEPIIKIIASKGDSSKVEKGLTSMWQAANARRRTALEKDVALAATLYAEVALVYKDVDVLMGDAKGIKKNRLEKLVKHTPFIPSIINPEFIYPSFGVDGELELFFELYNAKGKKIKQMWDGVEGAKTSMLEDDTEYDVWDGYTLTHRLVAVKGKEESDPILYEEHELSEFPVSIRYANGSELFEKEERKRRPLLFAYDKSGAFDNTTLLLSAGMTHVLATGFGPVFQAEPDAETDFSFYVDNQGPIRTVVPVGGKIKETKMEAFDRSAMELYGLVSNIAEESTMHGQALGGPMKGKQAYSTVSLLSQSGRLPLASIQNCAEESLARIMGLMLEDIRENNPSVDYLGTNDNLLSSQDIEQLGDYEVKVTLDVKLSQDAFKEAQVAGQLRGLIPEETIRQEILHITNEEETVKKIIKEQARGEMVKAMLPQSIEQLMAMVGQGQGGQGMQGGQGIEGMPEQGAQMQGAGEQIPPEIMAQLQKMLPPEKVAEIEQAIASGQMKPEQLMQQMQQMAGGTGQGMQGEQVVQGDPMAAMAGGGRLPQTEPTNPEQIG